MSILSQVTSGQRLSPLRVLLYGVAGIGKTSLASQAPKPLFISLEDGFGKLSVDSLPRPRDFRDLKKQLQGVHQEHHEYSTIVIDTIDRVEELVWEEVSKDQGVESVAHIGFAKGYEMALVHWRKFLSILDEIRDDRNMNIILLGHSVIDKLDSPDPAIGSYSFYRLDIHKKAAGMVKDWCDVILFANYKVLTKESREKITKGIHTGERFLFTEERPSHWGKNRFDLPYELPYEKSKGWEVFENALNESLKNQ